MPKVQSVTFGGDENATILLVPKRKKKKWVLTFYDIKGKGVKRGFEPASTKGMKEKPIFKLKFKNLMGIYSMLAILNFMRDKALYDKGWSDAKRNSQLKGILKDLPIEDLARLVKAVTAETDRRFNPEGKKKEEEKKEEEKRPEAVVQ